ncbi:MAG: hypothetical protein L0229_19065 [Blastocatellia bacterium]|nr:hypothetical protein [Blastocatellia bacterium]
MKRLSCFHRAGTAALSLALAIMCIASEVRVAAQSAPSPDEAIKRAAANEDMLKATEPRYSYRQEILFQTMAESGGITGQIHRVSEMTYDDLGKRVEKIITFPPSRLVSALGLMKPDFKSLVGVEPFFLTTEALPRSSIKFVERQKVDEINTYVFDVEVPIPKDKEKDKDTWPFKGRIWIDDQDFQIVKIEGRAVTEKKDRQRFPKFECYRENVDGKFWLPSFVYGEEVLNFPRFDLPVKLKITYSEYKRVQQR